MGKAKVSGNKDVAKKRKAPPHAWKLGQSGNPAGRPKLPEEVREELRAIFQAASPVAAEKLVALLDSFNEDVRLKAIEGVLKRVLGNEVLLTLGGQVAVKDVTDARDALTQKLVAAMASLAATEDGTGSALPSDGSGG